MRWCSLLLWKVRLGGRVQRVRESDVCLPNYNDDFIFFLNHGCDVM